MVGKDDKAVKRRRVEGEQRWIVIQVGSDHCTRGKVRPFIPASLHVALISQTPRLLGLSYSLEHTLLPTNRQLASIAQQEREEA